MVLTTGNKSEMSVGYATLYGDMCGGYNRAQGPLQDAGLSRSRAGATRHVPKGALGPAGVVMPESVIEQPPTAELRANQKDEDSLPPYAVLDGILQCLVEQEMSFEAIVAKGYDPATVKRVEQLLYVAEYKRRQAPPGVKLSARNFGRDRRYPITNDFREEIGAGAQLSKRAPPPGKSPRTMRPRADGGGASSVMRFRPPTTGTPERLISEPHRVNAGRRVKRPLIQHVAHQSIRQLRLEPR